MVRHSPVVALVLLLAACNTIGDRALSSDSDASRPVRAAAFAPAAKAPAAAPATAVGAAFAARADAISSLDAAASTLPQISSSGSMLLRSGTANLQVDSLDVGMNRVRDFARQVGATIGNASVQSGRSQLRSATLELRVAAERFDDLVAGLSRLGTVESVDVSAADVGEEFVDVTARVATAQQLERRLVELLATRTGKLSEVIQVERELARVREEIERYEGRLRYLRARSVTSTLSITVHEPVPVLADRPGTNPLREALKDAWRNFVRFVALFIASLGLLVPIGALGGAMVLVGRRWRSNGRPVADVA